MSDQEEMDESPVGRPLRAYNDGGFFSDHSTEEIVARKLNRFKGWKCAAGVENINIDFDGRCQLASCGVKATIQGQASPMIGDIYDGHFSTLKEWVTCTIGTCSCGADLFIPKHRADVDRSLLRKSANQDKEKEKQLPDNDHDLKSISALERIHFSHYKQIFWELGRRCNFDCSYCPSYVHNKTDRNRSWEELSGAYELLKKNFLGGSLGNFIISGGEPTINPHYMRLAKLISSDENKLSTHSNGTKKPDYYVELIRYSDLNLSIHFEYLSQFQKKIIEILRAVVQEQKRRDNQGQKRGHCEVLLMVPPGRMDTALAIEKELVEIPDFIHFCTHTFMPIRTNELAEEKDTGQGRKGNQLMEDYLSEELSEMGLRTEKFKLAEDTSP